MAQMAPALTEANASPGSPRKNSVDRYCSSTVPEDLKQTTLSKGVDLKLLSRNGVVRLLDDSDSSNNITNTTGEKSSSLSSPPKSHIRSEEDFTSVDMPNGHILGFKGNDVALSKSTNISSDDENRKPAILCERACASSTATTLTTPAGTCDIKCDDKNTRTTKHPLATYDSCKASIPERTAISNRKQAKLEGRASKLEKRLRRLQTRQIETHVHRQLNGIVDHLKRKKDFDACKFEVNSLGNFLQKKENSISGIDSISSSELTLRSHEIDNGLFPTKDIRNASSISNPSESHFENVIKYSPESVNKAIKNALSDERQKFETESLVEGLKAHVEHLEVMYDSDATEASSGDESEDDDQRRVSKSLRNAYQLELGEISSKWSWLQSQIINLERQIRRYEDIHKHVRISKQPVKLQPSTVEPEFDLTAPVNGLSTSKHLFTLSENSDLKANVFKEPQNHLRNGIKKSILNNTVIDDQDLVSKKLRMSDTKLPMSSMGADCTSQCARTSGVYPVRKRPLVHLSLLKQSGKLNGLSCQCSKPETPCISCCKTAKTIIAVDPMLPISDRVQTLDQTFHPVLSFATEIPLQFHFASILKKGGFESRTKPQSLKTSSSLSERNKKKISSKLSNKRSQLAKGAAATLLSSAKYRNKTYDRKRGYASLPSTPKNCKTEQDRSCHSELPRKRRAAAISADAQLQHRARSLSLPTTGSASSTPTSSPSPTPLSNSMPQSTMGLLLRKKRTSNAFDINNIVIPYSMASSTRVEKLQYKEILTPSWRVLDEAPPTSTESNHEDEKVEIEILDDDIFIERHEICEEHERKRFLGFLTKKRKRSQRQSNELGHPDDPLNTPPGTPCMTHSPTGSSMSGSLTPTGGTPLFSRSQSLDYKLAHRRSSSTDSLVKLEGETWPIVNPFTTRSFPLSEKEEAMLKLPTPLPTPIPSRTASPLMSPVSSPLCSPLASPSSDIDMNDRMDIEKNEWTVKLVTGDTESTNGDPNQPRKGIVLKLAKR